MWRSPWLLTLLLLGPSAPSSSPSAIETSDPPPAPRAVLRRRRRLASPTPAPCAANRTAIAITVTPDRFPLETSWTLLTAARPGVVLAKGGAVGAALCADTRDGLAFTIFDSSGDGLATGGAYAVRAGAQLVASGARFGASETTFFAPGCRRAAAVTIVPDGFAARETSWQLRSRGGAVLAWGGALGAKCCTSVAHSFEIRDSFGDGLCCANGRGSYSLAYNGATIARGGKFGRQETVTFASGCRHVVGVRPGAVSWNLTDTASGALLASGGEGSHRVCTNSTELTFRPVFGAAAGLELTFDGRTVAAGRFTSGRPFAFACTEFGVGTSSWICCPAGFSPNSEGTCQTQIIARLGCGCAASVASCACPASAPAVAAADSTALVVSNPTRFCSNASAAACRYTAQVRSPCLPSPCQNGGVCVEARSPVVRCDCSANFSGTFCEQRATLIAGECSCTGRGCFCETSLSMQQLATGGVAANTSGGTGLRYGFELHSAHLRVSAKGNFGSKTEVIDSIRINGAAVSGTCNPNCECCLRYSQCDAVDVTTVAKAVGLGRLNVTVHTSLGVADCGYKSGVVLAAQTLLSLSVERTITAECSCSGAGCSCSVVFAEVLLPGTGVGRAWLSATARGDTGARDLVDRTEVDGQVLALGRCAGSNCKCCDAMPCFQAVNATEQAADGSLRVTLRNGGSTAAACDFKVNVTLGLLIHDIDMCMPSRNPCANGGGCTDLSAGDPDLYRCECKSAFAGRNCTVCATNHIRVTVESYSAVSPVGVGWYLRDSKDAALVAGLFTRWDNGTTHDVSYCSAALDFRFIVSTLDRCCWGKFQVTFNGKIALQSAASNASRAEEAHSFSCGNVRLANRTVSACCRLGYTPRADGNAVRCVCPHHSVGINVIGDRYTSETSWALRAYSPRTKKAGGVLLSGSVTLGGTLWYCGVSDSYQLTMLDTASDGMCCKHGSGGYSVTLDGKIAVKSTGKFRASEFCYFTAGCNHQVGVDPLVPKGAAGTMPSYDVNWQLTDSLGNFVTGIGERTYHCIDLSAQNVQAGGHSGAEYNFDIVNRANTPVPYTVTIDSQVAIAATVNAMSFSPRKSFVCAEPPLSPTYWCCPPGYNGTSCVDVRECAHANGFCDRLTLCTNTVGNHTCGACPAGYAGNGYAGCSNIDDCASNPCHNDGKCADGVQTYNCTCIPPFTGERCELVKHPAHAEARCDCETVNRDSGMCSLFFDKFVMRVAAKGVNAGYASLSLCKANSLTKPFRMLWAAVAPKVAAQRGLCSSANSSSAAVLACASAVPVSAMAAAGTVNVYVRLFPTGSNVTTFALPGSTPPALPKCRDDDALLLKKFKSGCSSLVNVLGCTKDMHGLVTIKHVPLSTFCEKSCKICDPDDDGSAVPSASASNASCPEADVVGRLDYSRIDGDDCISAPCQNGARCVDSIDAFKCNCTGSWIGALCDKDFDDCMSNPCLNSATCVDGLNNYTCSCTLGFFGEHCGSCIGHRWHVGITPDKFPSDTSWNIRDAKGKMIIERGDPTAAIPCPKTTCQGHYDFCSNATTYSITVFDKYGDGMCCWHGQGSWNVTGDDSLLASGGIGPPGGNFTDSETVEINVDDCTTSILNPVGNECMNGSSCVDGENAYTCSCAPGFEGKLCGMDIDECARLQPCKNDAVSCADSTTNPTIAPFNFSCACAAGFEGRNCTENVDECLSSPCLGISTCADRVNSVECVCGGDNRWSYLGDLCQYRTFSLELWTAFLVLPLLVFRLIKWLHAHVSSWQRRQRHVQYTDERGDALVLFYKSVGRTKTKEEVHQLMDAQDANSEEGFDELREALRHKYGKPVPWHDGENQVAKPAWSEAGCAP